MRLSRRGVFVCSDFASWLRIPALNYSRLAHPLSAVPYLQRPSNLKVQLGMCALYGAASCLFVHLAATSYLFRAYLLWSSVVAAAVAFADAPTSTL